MTTQYVLCFQPLPPVLSHHPTQVRIVEIIYDPPKTPMTLCFSKATWVPFRCCKSGQ